MNREKPKNEIKGLIKSIDDGIMIKNVRESRAIIQSLNKILKQSQQNEADLRHQVSEISNRNEELEEEIKAISRSK